MVEVYFMVKCTIPTERAKIEWMSTVHARLPTWGHTGQKVYICFRARIQHFIHCLWVTRYCFKIEHFKLWPMSLKYKLDCKIHKISNIQKLYLSRNWMICILKVVCMMTKKHSSSSESLDYIFKKYNFEQNYIKSFRPTSCETFKIDDEQAKKHKY